MNSVSLLSDHVVLSAWVPKSIEEIHSRIRSPVGRVSPWPHLPSAFQVDSQCEERFFLRRAVLAGVFERPAPCLHHSTSITFISRIRRVLPRL